MPTSDQRPDVANELCRYRARRAAGSSEALHLQGLGAVKELESRLMQYYGVKHAVCVANATLGLLGVALALGLRDAEFIAPPFGYGGSVAPWLLLGNRPVFADVEHGGVTLDARRAADAISERTRAVLAIDAFGYPSDVSGLRRVAAERGVPLVVDAAQSFGAIREGRPSGQGADAAVVSFGPGKTLDVGEGGAIMTDRDDLYEALVWWTQHPSRQKRELGLHRHHQLGINARIHPLAAAWALSDWHAALARMQRRVRQMRKVLDEFERVGVTELRGDAGERSTSAYVRAIVGGTVPRRAATTTSPRWRVDPHAVRAAFLPAQCPGGNEAATRCPRARRIADAAVAIHLPV